MHINALVVTFISGLFFIIGALFSYKAKNNQKLSDLSIGIAFSVLLLLVFLEIGPEVIECFSNNYNSFVSILWMLGWTICGILILKGLDLFIPHHDHAKETKHHENHLYHIGFITFLALLLHNFIEGIGLYTIALNSLKSGLLMALGVGLHNLVFGILITSTLKETNKKKLITLLIILTFSSTLGGLLINILKINLTEYVIGSILSLTLGMIAYLICFELLPEMKETSSKKSTIIGVIVGIIIIVINSLL